MNNSPISRQNTSIPRTGMVIKVRVVLLGCVFIAFLLALPLFVVWKQSQLSNGLLVRKELADSLALLRGVEMKIAIESRSLGMTTYIERFAEDVCGMEYPRADRIIVIAPRGKTTQVSNNVPHKKLSTATLTKGRG